MFGWPMWPIGHLLYHLIQNFNIKKKELIVKRVESLTFMGFYVNLKKSYKHLRLKKHVSFFI